MTATITERQVRRGLNHILVTAPVVIALAIIGWLGFINGAETVASTYVSSFGVVDVVAMAIGYVYPIGVRRLSRRVASYLVTATDEGEVVNVRPNPAVQLANQRLNVPLQ